MNSFGSSPFIIQAAAARAFSFFLLFFSPLCLRPTRQRFIFHSSWHRGAYVKPAFLICKNPLRAGQSRE